MKFRCRVCNSKNIKEIIKLGNQPWGNDFKSIKSKTRCNKYPLNFVICVDCKTSQIDFTIPKEKMFVKHSYMSGTTKTLNQHFQKVTKEIQPNERITF